MAESKRLVDYPAKTSPVNADIALIADSADSNKLKTIQIASLVGLTVQPNIIIVNQTQSSITGKQYQTYATALAYVVTQTPSATNPWVILLPSGIFSESIALYEYVYVLGRKTVISGSLTCDTDIVNSIDNNTGVIGGIYNCEIRDIDSGIVAFNCIINELSGATKIHKLRLFDTDIVAGTFIGGSVTMDGGTVYGGTF